MEHKFDIKQMEYKPVAKKQETTIVKICKKKKVVDEVFPEGDVENIYDLGPLIIDKLDDKIIDLASKIDYAKNPTLGKKEIIL